MDTEIQDAAADGAVGTDETVEAVDTVETVEEELLVEEISIDGMCGVY